LRRRALEDLFLAWSQDLPGNSSNESATQRESRGD
jgi:hypothetical protein